MVYIDPEVCIGCDACIPVCPVEAIGKESAVKPEWESYKQLNAERAKAWWMRGSAI